MTVWTAVLPAAPTTFLPLKGGGLQPSYAVFDLRIDARTVEPERALGGYFMPAASRQAWWALLLIHHELAQIPQRSADANLRLIRLGWWRETLTEAAAGDPQAVQAHPAIQELASALSQSLSSGSLSAWLSAWEASDDAQGGSDSASEAGLMRLGIEALSITLAGLEPLAEQTGLAFDLARQALRIPSQGSVLTTLASERPIRQTGSMLSYRLLSGKPSGRYLHHHAWQPGSGLSG